jgi:hypothetical protein
MEKALHNVELVIGKLYVEGFWLLQVLPPYVTYNNLSTYLSYGEAFNRQTSFVMNYRCKISYRETRNLTSYFSFPIIYQFFRYVSISINLFKNPEKF